MSSRTPPGRTTSRRRWAIWARSRRPTRSTPYSNGRGGPRTPWCGWAWWSSGHSNYNALQVDAEPPPGARLPDPRRVHAVEEFGRRHGVEQQRGRKRPRLRDVSAEYPARLGTVDLRCAARAGHSRPVGTAGLGAAAEPRANSCGGWTLSGIATVQSGFPFTPQLGYNPSNDGDSRNPVRPSWNPAFQGPVIEGSPNQYFNPAAFAPPAGGTYGNVGRDTLTGPGTRTIDLSVVKNTALSERLKRAVPGRGLQRAESRQLRDSQHRGFLLGIGRAFGDGGSDHGHFHRIAADSVRAESPMVRRDATRAAL